MINKKYWKQFFICFQKGNGITMRYNRGHNKLHRAYFHYRQNIFDVFKFKDKFKFKQEWQQEKVRQDGWTEIKLLRHVS